MPRAARRGSSASAPLLPHDAEAGGAVFQRGLQEEGRQPRDAATLPGRTVPRSCLLQGCAARARHRRGPYAHPTSPYVYRERKRAEIGAKGTRSARGLQRGARAARAVTAGTRSFARSPRGPPAAPSRHPAPFQRSQPPRTPLPPPGPGPSPVQLRAEAHGGAAPGPQRSAAPPWRLPPASRPAARGPARPGPAPVAAGARPLPSEPRAHLRSGSPGSRSCGTWTAASCPPPGPEPHQGRRRRMRRRRRRAAGGCGSAVSLMRRGGRAAAATGRARGTRGAWRRRQQRQQRQQRPPHVTAGLASPSRTCASRVTGRSGDLAATAPRAGAKRREEKLAASCLPPPPRLSAAPAADWAAPRG